MPGPLELPQIVSQLLHVQTLAGAEQSRPEFQQQMAGALAAEHLKQDRERVDRLEKRDETSSVDNKAQQEQEKPMHFSGRRRHPPPPEEEEQETRPSSSSPWAGNIIDKKI